MKQEGRRRAPRERSHRDRDGLVGAAGIEPATICSQSRYATAALRPVLAIILRVPAGRSPAGVRVLRRKRKSPGAAPGPFPSKPGLLPRETGV